MPILFGDSIMKQFVPFIAFTAILMGRCALASDDSNNNALKVSLGDVELQGNWVYNDVDAGFTEAKKTGKPLLIVFR
jgi:hypothetical protein